MKSFAEYVQLVESLCPKCGMDPCHCGEVATNEESTQVDEADRPYMTVGGVRKREDDEGYGKQKPSGNMSVGHAVHINGRHWKSFDSKAEAQRVSDSVQKKYPDKKVSVHSKLNFH